MAKQKGFKAENPAATTYANPAQQFTTPEASVKVAKQEVRTKSARLHLKVYPEIKEDIEALAEARNTSVMELVGAILEAYTTEQAAEIAAYKELQERIERLKNGED